MVKTENTRKENHATKVTKIAKIKRLKYLMNKTIIAQSICAHLSSLSGCGSLKKRVQSMGCKKQGAKAAFSLFEQVMSFSFHFGNLGFGCFW